MWVKSKTTLLEPFVESTLVSKDYIVVESKTNNFSVCSKDDSSNIFKGTFSTPMMQFFKVHKNHPLEVRMGHQQGVHIAPPGYPRRNDKRMPADLYRDKLDYDCASLILIPFEIRDDSAPRAVQEGKSRRTLLENAFTPEKQDDALQATLFYIPHGINVPTDIRRYGFIPAPQVINHLWEWLITPHPIYSRKGFNESSNHEGDIRVPLEKARETLAVYGLDLEKRFKAQLMFREFKEGIAKSAQKKS